MRRTKKKSNQRKKSPGSRPAQGKPAKSAKGASKGKKGKGKKSGKAGKSPIPEPDILSPAAMLNVYYIAHNAADCLVFRGYPWPGAIKKGKKRK
ncbi:small lysine-rich protein 1 [Microcaecilia unicolor]|uniref:Small lysine-rich protein 1 n=1 Tax=Microcaecilia unicolor TaxID=1415580 RepID=A0A6P7Z077_9AMPH|nr:small lysine-rich protein 1 [Microcaecilia unicolor]